MICSEVGLWFNLSDQNEFPELYLDIVADNAFLCWIRMQKYNCLESTAIYLVV